MPEGQPQDYNTLNTSMASILYMRPDLASVMAQEPPMAFPTNSENMNKMFLEQGLSETGANFQELAKAGLAEFYMGHLGIGNLRKSSLGLNRMGSLPSRAARVAGQTIIDVYSFLGGRTRGWSTKHFLKPEAGAAKFLTGKAKNPTPALLSYLIPKGTGMRSMLFWNLASGEFGENFSSYSGAAWEVAKYATGAQVVNRAGKFLAGKMQSNLVSVLGSDTTAAKIVKKDFMMEGLERAMGPSMTALDRKYKMDTIAKMRGQKEVARKGMFSTLGSWIKGEATIDDVATASRANSIRALGAGATLFGAALRTVNFLGGVTAAVSIAGQYNRYRSSIKSTFQREALGYETAYSHVPEIPQASSERQRAIEAIQSSGMNLRNFIGSEASMIH